MLCLDTYALMEIQLANPKFAQLTDEEFTITEWTLTEFYRVLLRENISPAARYWVNKFIPFCSHVPMPILLNAIDFRSQNKKRELSIFDCVGYIFSRDKNYKFVTGDKEFENMPGVLFIRK
ncbi:hypothetical protein HYY74_01340 [Candidatus Woesearchaeota archaeon]|nr:hypothetical protein [Candidatus Woesearchaeota archaeon]